MSCSVPDLARTTAETGRYASELVAFCRPEERDAVERSPGVRFTRMPFERLRPWADFRARTRLRDLVGDCEIVHIHGLWSAHGSAAADLSSRSRTPVIVSAHGMLERWAVAQRRWKKLLYSAAVERPRLRRAACLRALTHAEVADYRNFGLTNPVAVVPNGIVVPESLDPEPFLDLFPHLRNHRIVLYLGRIDHKKGVDLLCRAWASLSHPFPDARLVLAGPVSRDAGSLARRLVSELKISSSVTFTGLLRGRMKWSAFAAAGVFVLPSRSEGFSMAVLEALASRVPVLITRQCNFPEVVFSDCGWVVEPETAAIRTALGEALSMSDSELARLGINGRNLVRRRYSWPTIGRQMADVYDWILGGTRPTSVEIVE